MTAMTGAERNKAGRTAKLSKAAELRLPSAHILLMRLNHNGPDEHMFFREDIFWIDLCMTPRRPDARARYVDRWGPHRYVGMGSIIALPPGFQLELKHEGGRHLSLICALQARDVHRWLPPDFEWTDRRLETLLDISSSEIRGLMLRLAEEVRESRLAALELCEALVVQLSVEIARYLTGVGEPTENGGLAAWRLKVIDKRLAQAGEPPTLVELASLCDLSVRQLTRGFRTTRGCSIGDYMAQNRIETAKRRLATDESIKSISTGLGFSSQSTFTYTFRRATGFTPRAFRNRLLRAIEPRVRPL
ncbi:helix-turn-helix transcriptional regulator [Phenylobacterium sp. LjRoot225]|uniref:helix-turn-helix transcriptional regulator n=1 Tax=Phenylobacterium sp. LjRoot225 TaxID=3342285 RepID=UPI003ECF07EF